MSAATNKIYSVGEIVNFVQTDSSKLFNLSSQIPMIATFPFLLVFCIVALSIMLGWTFIFGMFVFVFAFLFNLEVSRRRARLQKEYMKNQDGRINMTT